MKFYTYSLPGSTVSLRSGTLSMPSHRGHRGAAAQTQADAAHGGFDETEMRLRTHAFVQGLLQRACLKEARAKELFTTLTNDTTGACLVRRAQTTTLNGRCPSLSVLLNVAEAGYNQMLRAAKGILGNLQLTIRRVKFSVSPAVWPRE